MPHEIKVSVELQNLEGKRLVVFDGDRGGGRDITVQDGQVDVDSSTVVGRSLNLTVADPSGELRVGEDVNYVNRMLHVEVGVVVPELSKTVWAPVFTGPITDAPRSGDVVQFTAQGKPRMAQHGIRDVYVIPKGTKKTTAIRKIMHDLSGETFANMRGIPDLPPVLTKQLVMRLQSRPWDTCWNIALSMSRHLAYDGAGQIRMQRFDLKNPVYTFRTSKFAPGLIDTDPEVSTNWNLIFNAVRLTGGATDTTDAPVVFAYAPPNNPFSPQRLGRNGVNHYLWHVLKIESLKTEQACRRVAHNILVRDMIATRMLKFEALPMYVFDELDLVGVHLPGFIGETQLSQFTIPLLTGNAPTMSFGFNHRVSGHPFTRRH